MTAPTPDLPPLAETHIILGEWMAANNSMLSSMQYDSLKIIIDGLIADRAAGRALEAVPQWIPVGDRKPARYGQHVLVLTTNADDEPHAVTACWNGDKLFLGMGGRRVDPVTHWMAIPSLAASPAASPVPEIGMRDATYADSTPLLHVGSSAFEDWFQAQPFACTSGIKQISRDSYAAGMGDPLVTYAAASPVPADMVREALVELVALKDMKERFQYEGEWTSKRVRGEYCERQPLAWEAARIALKGSNDSEHHGADAEGVASISRAHSEASGGGAGTGANVGDEHRGPTTAGHGHTGYSLGEEVRVPGRRELQEGIDLTPVAEDLRATPQPSADMVLVPREPNDWRYCSLEAKVRDLLHLLSFADIKTPSEGDATEAAKVMASIRNFINTERLESIHGDFILVPRKATDAMRYAWMEVYDEKGWNSFQSIWDAALAAAAPSQPAAPTSIRPDPKRWAHVAVSEGGELRWMTGRKFQECELYTPIDALAQPSQPAETGERASIIRAEPWLKSAEVQERLEGDK